MNLKGVISNKIHTISGDILGGCDAAIISLPQVLAFGIATGLGANAGVLGAIILCLIGGIFGSKTPLVYGITGPVAIILCSIMATLNGNITDLIAIMFVAGIFQILIGLTALPAIVKYVPYPVISGFMNGIGTVIILLEIPSFFGVTLKGNPVENIIKLYQNISWINSQAIILGVLTLLLIFTVPKKYSKIFPSQLLALIICTILSVKLNFNVERISEVTFAFPKLLLLEFNISKWMNYLNYGFVLSIILSVESMLTLLVANSITKIQNSPQKMLIAQGFGNILCSMCGTTVGTAATMRSVAAIKSGATTKLSVFITPLILILMLYKFSNFVGMIPLSVLAGILIKVGYDIIDTKLLKALKFAPKDDLYVLFLVYILTVFYNLIFAVVAGITLASLLYAKRIGDKTHVVQSIIYDKDIIDMEKRVEKDFSHKIRIFHLNGQFFFGSATRIISTFDDILGTKYLILNYDSKDLLDISAIFALEDIVLRLKSQHIKILLVISNEIKEQLIQHEIISQIGEHHVFSEEICAVEFAKNCLKKKIR